MKKKLLSIITILLVLIAALFVSCSNEITGETELDSDTTIDKPVNDLMATPEDVIRNIALSHEYVKDAQAPASRNSVRSMDSGLFDKEVPAMTLQVSCTPNLSRMFSIILSKDYSEIFKDKDFMTEEDDGLTPGRKRYADYSPETQAYIYSTYASSATADPQEQAEYILNISEFDNIKVVKNADGTCNVFFRLVMYSAPDSTEISAILYCILRLSNNSYYDVLDSELLCFAYMPDPDEPNSVVCNLTSSKNVYGKDEMVANRLQTSASVESGTIKLGDELEVMETIKESSSGRLFFVDADYANGGVFISPANGGYGYADASDGEYREIFNNQKQLIYLETKDQLNSDIDKAYIPIKKAPKYTGDSVPVQYYGLGRIDTVSIDDTVDLETTLNELGVEEAPLIMEYKDKIETLYETYKLKDVFKKKHDYIGITLQDIQKFLSDAGYELPGKNTTI